MKTTKYEDFPYWMAKIEDQKVLLKALLRRLNILIAIINGPRNEVDNEPSDEPDNENWLDMLEDVLDKMKVWQEVQYYEDSCIDSRKEFKEIKQLTKQITRIFRDMKFGFNSVKIFDELKRRLPIYYS